MLSLSTSIIIEEISETPSPKKTIKHPKTPLKKTGSGNALSGLLMNYILAKANEQIKKKPPRKKKKVIRMDDKKPEVEVKEEESIDNTPRRMNPLIITPRRIQSIVRQVIDQEEERMMQEVLYNSLQTPQK